MCMRWSVCLLAALTGPHLASSARAADPPVKLVPPPKQVQWSPVAPIELAGRTPVIVLGEKATEPEQYAAERLQSMVARRFGQTWPIIREEAAQTQSPVAILLGQRSTHRWLDRICQEGHIELSESSPGHDGYVIAMPESGGHTVILVGGSNPRGVIYGQDTLFQLLQRTEHGPALARAAIRDWPSVPWRGRPQTSLNNYFREGELDCYLTARVNWIDLREGIYAVDPGTPLDKERISQVIREAKRRGLLTYAVVNCGVSADQYDPILDMYREFIQLGADGLWLSFDDKGPGEEPEKLVFEALELGRQHGITGPRIMINPPKGSYQTIADESNKDFNRKIMAIPGMEHALWTWTCSPTPEALAQARSIGLKARLGWWHNWTRPFCGFTYIRDKHITTTGRAYMEVPAMREGWNRPSYELLADGGDTTDMVMPWGGNSWGQYYLMPVMGWWAWDPAQHEWNATRGRIYDLVFGPDQVAAAMEFDDTLIRVRRLFRFPWQANEWEPNCPARLRKRADVPNARAMLKQLERLQARIAEQASAQTLIDPGQMRQVYLDPMLTEVRTGMACTEAQYPEDWWPEHQRRILTAVHAGQLDEADRLIAGVRDRLLAEVQQIAGSHANLALTEPYVNWWTSRAKLTARQWQEMMAARRAMIDPKIAEFSYYVYIVDRMLEGVDSPPLRWGTGGAAQQNRVLAKLLPLEREQFWGKWVGGIHRTPGREVTAFWMGRDGTGTVGCYSELPVELPISGRRDSLGLLFFVAGHNRESLGLETVPNRWGGYRYLQVLWDDMLLWEVDVGVQRTRGEWFMVPLPAIPEDIEVLTLRLRVEDRREPGLDAMIFVSPMYLLEMTR